jgi:hypothetical protein
MCVRVRVLVLMVVVMTVRMSYIGSMSVDDIVASLFGWCFEMLL